MELMDAPTSWREIGGQHNEDHDWTEECQGVTTDGRQWIFSSNGSTALGDNPRALYFFLFGTTLVDDEIDHTINLDDLFDWLQHIGPVAYHNSCLYIAHWKATPPTDQAIVFRNTSRGYTFDRIVNIGSVVSSTGETFVPEVQGIDPNTGMLVTMRGRYEDWQSEVFLHDPVSGEWRHTIPLSMGVRRIAGVTCSARNIYIACDFRDSAWGGTYMGIYYFSRLSGIRMGAIAVLAEEDNQEMEGVCFFNGQAQIHVVLLENINVGGHDNIFFKQFLADRPEVA